VGLQAELPSGTHAEHNLSHTEFYKFLLEKKQSYEIIPLDRFKASAWRGSNLGEIITDKGSFLKDIDCFDHVELGVSMKDARNMALSSRKLLEMSFLALLDSGIDYRARNVGVYMAGVPFDLHSLVGPSVLEAVGSFSGSPAQIANRISYHLDLLGPSVPTDNACSSSLAALHLAVQALRVGDCEAAVVGGCQLNHRFVDWVQYSRGHVLSPDGKCKPFDESANGFSRGEGAVAIVIKRLSDAVRDGDHIYATILGTGINSGGGAAPVSAPIARAQEDAMERAYHGTGHDPRQVDFVEMHATGTAAGDPTEANWVGRRFGRPDGAELMVGSVKGNIGHLEITSFLASLCKVCSMLEHGVIPPNVNLSTLNPAIMWDKYSMRVPTEPTPLHVHDAAGRALVSICGSGIGGTNGHVVVQSPPPCTSADELLEDDGQSAVLFFAGGLSPRSAAAVSQQLKDYLSASQCTDLRSIAYTLGRRTRQMTWRSFCIYHSGDPVVMSDPKMAPRIHPPIVFVLSGQGPQHISMGRQLLRYKAFKDSVQSMDIVHERVTGVSLIKTYGMFSANDIGASQALPTIWPISIILPALAILQIGLVDLLRSVGIAPDAFIGHSAGETVVMYASGSIPREMAVEIAIARGTALALTERLDSSMAALGCRPSLARQIVGMVMANKSGTLDIACYNAADAVTLSGSADLIDEAVKMATDRGIFARRLRTGVAVHSSLMDHCKSSYEESVRFIFERYASSIVAPSTAIYSAVTGKRWNNAFTPEYMWHNNRRPVLFSGAVSALLDTLPGAMFVEISPHPALSSYILAHGVSPEHVSCPLRRCKPGNRFEEHEAFLRSTAELIIMGSNAIDFRVLTGTSRVTEDFPAYPFVRKQVPYYPDYAPSIREQFRVRDGPLRYPNLRINKATHPDLAQHIIRNESIMPAAGYLEMVFETGANIVWDLKFTGMMPILEDKLLDVDFVVAGVHRWSITSRMHAPLSDTMERTHASGFMATNVADGGSWPVIDVRSIMERCRKVDIPDMYEHISYFAQYGPLFQRMHSFFIGKDEGIVCVQGFDAHLRPGYVVNPAILDAAFHPIILPIVTSNVDRNSYYLPSAIAYVQLHRGISKTDSSLYSYYRLKSDLASDCKVLWVVASSTLDVAAARGFSRSLRHELRNTVRLRAAFFAIERSYQDMLSFVHYIEDTSFTSDDEIFVDDKNVITVPRIIPSPPPSSRTITSFHDTLISCQLELHHVVVEVAQFGASGAGLAGVVGRVIRVGPHTSLQVDAIVYAIVSVPTEGVLVVIHEGQAVDASKLGLHFPVALILPLFVCAAALGILSLLHPERFDSKSVVIVNDFEHGRVMGDVITILKRIDWNVQQIDAAVSEAGLQALGSADFVISGTTLPSDEEILRGCTQRGCRIFFCTSRHHGLPYLIECHSWTVFDALTALADPLAPVISSIKAIEGTSCHNDVHATPADDRLLFPQNETFLLIGGLGSLGIQIACWLYAKGARHIVLTSRSGGIRDDSATNYPRLQYLQELSDLSLTIEKCDASFLENVLRVVQKITPRIGGCILLSGLLNDRMFTSHDPKSYREAFPPKVGAFKALECALSISSLRFFITISTIITCGSTGQTSYSSANSVLEELTSKYRNAFSLVAPFILDTPFFFHGDKFEFNHRYDDLALSGMTREEVCQALEDGILKLQDGPFQSSLYYPDIDWAALSAALGPSQLYGHLVTVQETSENIAGNANKEKRSAEEIIQIVRASLDVPPEDFSVDVPFTSYGLDSLLAARISQSLKPYIQVTQMQLLGNMTLTDLLTAIQKAEQNPDLQELSSNRLKTIQSMVDKYVAQLPDDQDTDQYDGYAVFEGKCVLVTGTTGALGSYVLGALSSDASISKVYALNRTGEDPLFERQKAALEARGIDPNILHDRIILLEVDYAADMLGLSASLYAELAQSVTHVVHNAWRVDLARDITAFDDNLQTLIALIRLALNARARLTFIGTVAVLGRGPKNVPCPEEHIEGSYALTNGYSASKWIGEQIIKAAVTKFSSCIRKSSRMFGATILRVGQLCADQDGRWSPSEWVPLLIRSAKALRCLPLDDGTVSWTPIDVAAHAIVDIACADTVPPPIVHLAHPHPVPWHLLAQKMGAILDIPVLPFAQWLNCVESSYHPDAFDEIPVLKAIDMFRGAAPDIASDHLEAFGLARMDLTNLISLSPTMSNQCLRRLQENDVEKWLRYCKV
ncbi:hypothetical protein FISHEDRAFT_44661, partial [Fistulina hepatica ATCC 64428]